MRRFTEIQRSTGAPREMLTARLRKLEDCGVITGQQCSQHPPHADRGRPGSGTTAAQPAPMGPEMQGLGICRGPPALPTRCSCGRPMLGVLSVGEAGSRLNQGCRLPGQTRLQEVINNRSGVVSLSTVSDQGGTPPDSTKAANRMAIRFEIFL